MNTLIDKDGVWEKKKYEYQQIISDYFYNIFRSTGNMEGLT